MRLAATDPVTQDLIRCMADQFGPAPPSRIGVAVSGGSDSMAALYLLHAFAKENGSQVFAVTVDHGLRPEAAVEAARVASVCNSLRVAHDTLTWTGWTGAGNLQNEARLARYRLMADWARSRGISTLVLGHTQDDQAETVLMRLARGAGVDGLTAMTPQRVADGIIWARPLLGQRREVLRAYLRDRGADWTDDPSNADNGYDRVKAREALVALEPLGITVPQLAQVASNMEQARAALDRQTADTVRSHVQIDAGAVKVDWGAFQSFPVEIRRRLLSAALRWISGSGYAPRGSSLSEALDVLNSDTPATLQGCHMMRHRGDLWVFRELAAVRDLATPVTEMWDRRWRVTGPAHENGDYVLRPLGETGLQQWANWRETGRPRAFLCSLPAVWDHDQVVAAPLGLGPDTWQIGVPDAENALIEVLLSH